VLIGIGNALSRLGDFAAASAPLRQALAVREASGDGLGEAVARHGTVARIGRLLDAARGAASEAASAENRTSARRDRLAAGARSIVRPAKQTRSVILRRS